MGGKKKLNLDPEKPIRFKNYRIFCRLTRNGTQQCIRGCKILQRATCFTSYLIFFLKSWFQSAAGNVIQTIKKRPLIYFLFNRWTWIFWRNPEIFHYTFFLQVCKHLPCMYEKDVELVLQASQCVYIPFHVLTSKNGGKISCSLPELNRRIMYSVVVLVPWID